MTLEEAKNQIKELEKHVKKLSDEGTQMSAAAQKGQALQKKFDDAGTTPDELMAKVQDLQEQLATANAQLADFKKKAGDQQVQAMEARKNREFDALLSEGKANEAQRQAWLAGDMSQFMKLHEPVKLARAGSGAPAQVIDTEEEAQKQISREAKLLLSESKVQTLGEGIRRVLSEKKDLAKQYYNATGGHAPHHAR